MRRYLRRSFRPRYRYSAAWLPVVISLVLAAVLFILLSRRMKPMVKTIAVSNAVNEISLAVSRAASECLLDGESDYLSFVDVITNETGQVTSLSFRVNEGNRFREKFIGQLCNGIENIEPQALSVPLGNLSGVLWLSALGPNVRVSIYSVGDVSTEYVNEFTSVGINQTKHSIFLKATVTIYLMIPGEIIPVSAEETVCLAETVIVGEVPETYLNLQDGDN